MGTRIDKAMIKKKILHPGKKYIPLPSGTRLKFHFQTRKPDGTLVDDSRTMAKPMELVLGLKFKLEVWEVIVQKMALNEVAKFTVDKTLVGAYPFLSKKLRDIGKNQEERPHCCGMTLQNEGIGYKDLDDLLANPSDLEFVIELFSIELPQQYEKEQWQMTNDEKRAATTVLREKGNSYFRQKKYSEAEDCYAEAVGILEQLMLTEKPYDTEWFELVHLKVPVLLNYAQCRLLASDYYAVIQYCTEILTFEPNNVKAVFRRGRAHLGAWNPIEAKKDFLRSLELDPSLNSAVMKELKLLDEEQKKRDNDERIKMKKMF